MPKDFAELRTDYETAGLDVRDVPEDPLALLSTWLDEALDAGLYEPHAMTLATADADGAPSARVVLLRGLDARGLAFYTNYESRKGRELDANPRAALTFYWAPFHRQVRVEGPVERVPAAESDAYFATRPAGSQRGAWASPQSAPLADRDELERRVRDVEQRFGDAIPRPPHWGGFRLAPTRVEFWQGRPSRLHDRVEYVRGADGGFARRRLAP